MSIGYICFFSFFFDVVFFTANSQSTLKFAVGESSDFSIPPTIQSKCTKADFREVLGFFFDKTN